VIKYVRNISYSPVSCIYKYILFSYLGLGDCDVKNARKLASELKRPSSLVFEAYSFMLRYIKDNLETEGIYHR